MNTTFTKTFSIKDVYGTDTPEIPQGYKAVDFRLPRRGECYVSYGGYWLLACEDHGMLARAMPFIILSKIPDPIIIKGSVENTIKTTVKDIYAKDVTIPEGYEFVDFRVPKAGDYYVVVRYDNPIDYCAWNFDPADGSYSRIIVKNAAKLRY